MKPTIVMESLDNQRIVFRDIRELLDNCKCVGLICGVNCPIGGVDECRLTDLKHEVDKIIVRAEKYYMEEYEILEIIRTQKRRRP